MVRRKKQRHYFLASSRYKSKSKYGKKGKRRNRESVCLPIQDRINNNNIEKGETKHKRNDKVQKAIGKDLRIHLKPTDRPSCKQNDEKICRTAIPVFSSTEKVDIKNLSPVEKKCRSSSKILPSKHQNKVSSSKCTKIRPLRSTVQRSSTVTGVDKLPNPSTNGNIEKILPSPSNVNCTVCQFEFCSKFAFIRHKKIYFKDSFRCSYCTEQFDSSCSLMLHKRLSKHNVEHAVAEKNELQIPQVSKEGSPISDSNPSESVVEKAVVCKNNNQIPHLTKTEKTQTAFASNLSVPNILNAAVSNNDSQISNLSKKVNTMSASSSNVSAFNIPNTAMSNNDSQISYLSKKVNTKTPSCTNMSAVNIQNAAAANIDCQTVHSSEIAKTKNISTDSNSCNSSKHSTRNDEVSDTKKEIVNRTSLFDLLDMCFKSQSYQNNHELLSDKSLNKAAMSDEETLSGSERYGCAPNMNEHSSDEETLSGWERHSSDLDAIFHSEDSTETVPAVSSSPEDKETSVLENANKQLDNEFVSSKSSIDSQNSSSTVTKSTNQESINSPSSSVPVPVTVQPLSGSDCDICGESLPSQFVLGIHKRLHSLPNTLQCSSCNKIFLGHSELDSHMEDCTVDLFICETCPDAPIFKSAKLLQLHEKGHEPKDKVTNINKVDRGCKSKDGPLEELSSLVPKSDAVYSPKKVEPTSQSSRLEPIIVEPEEDSYEYTPNPCYQETGFDIHWKSTEKMVSEKYPLSGLCEVCFVVVENLPLHVTCFHSNKKLKTFSPSMQTAVGQQMKIAPSHHKNPKRTQPNEPPLSHKDSQSNIAQVLSQTGINEPLSNHTDNEKLEASTSQCTSHKEIKASDPYITKQTKNCSEITMSRVDEILRQMLSSSSLHTQDNYRESGHQHSNPYSGRQHSKPDSGRLPTNLDSGSQHSSPNSGRLHSNPDSGRLHSNPDSTHLHSNQDSGRLQSNPESGRLHSNPDSSRLHSNQDSGHLHSNPDSGRLHSNPDCGHLHSSPESGHLHSNLDSGCLDSNQKNRLSFYSQNCCKSLNSDSQFSTNINHVYYGEGDFKSDNKWANGQKPRKRPRERTDHRYISYQKMPKFTNDKPKFQKPSSTSRKLDCRYPCDICELAFSSMTLRNAHRLTHY